MSDPQDRCVGVVPLRARLRGWERQLLSNPGLVHSLLAEYGSPLNVLEPSALGSNAQELVAEGAARGIRCRPFFARKANKCLCLVDAAIEAGCGVDLASHAELAQAISRGARGPDCVVSAAVKPRAVLELATSSGATVVLDNVDEAELLAKLASEMNEVVPVALRLALSSSRPGAPRTRFGMEPDQLVATGLRLIEHDSTRLDGLHFHVDGYSAEDRVRGIAECLGLAERLRAAGAELRFIDAGGGIPMSYLDDPGAEAAYLEELRLALLGRRAPITYQGAGLGSALAGEELRPGPRVYPVGQSPIRGEWFASILDACLPGSQGTVAEAIRVKDLELRLEPGRALVDGCGLTLAQVEFTKQSGDATLAGLAMNRNQYRTHTEDSMLDPILVPGSGDRGPELEAYLVGSYCTEGDLVSWRRLRFPEGIQRGDAIGFANSAGYFMHILESSSHQMPLAQNIVSDGVGGFEPDPIEGWKFSRPHR